jgi:peptide/nickel transport system permease protein
MITGVAEDLDIKQRAKRRLALPPTRAGKIGLIMLAAVVLLALAGPELAPYSPRLTVGAPYAPSGGHFLLGTDVLGRDVLSRVLFGGRTVLIYAGLATILAYLAGLAFGLFAGYLRGWPDQALMRSVDVLLSFPALVFILLVSTAAGQGIIPVMVATAIIQAPAIARIVRTATLEQSVRGFVEAAVARGESAISVLRREILPNIARPLSADVGLRFTWSVLLIASVNFLGLGLQPPAADWGLMVSENWGGIGANPAAVLVPAALLGLLCVAINLLSDSLAGGRQWQ